MSYYQAVGAGPSLTDKTEWVKVGGKDVCWDHTLNQYVDGSFCGPKPKAASSSPGFFESLTRGIASAGALAPGMPGYQPGLPGYQPSTNTWILPVVGLGAAAILAVVLLKK